MNSKNLAQKSEKLAFFCQKRAFFDPSPKKKWYPSFHEICIRGLENASIDLKIGIHVPWGSRKKVSYTDFEYMDFFPILGGLKVEKMIILSDFGQKWSFFQI